MQNPVLSKISKLLALSKDKHATEAEASLAAEHVQRLLQEHNLSLTEVEAAGGGTDTGLREQQLTDRRAMYTYQKSLMAALADLNFCLHQVNKVFDPEGKSSRSKEKGRWNHRHFLVGRAINVQATLLTYDYLTGALGRLAADAGYDARNRDGKLFLEGGVSRLTVRLQQLRRQRLAEDAARKAQAQAQGSTKNALVLSDVYGSEADLNNDVLNGFPLGTTATKHREIAAREAARRVRQDELVAAGMEKTKAFYVAYGYPEDVAADAAARHNRRRQRQRSGRGYSQRWTAGNDREYAKVNSTAYRAGAEAGGSIGLDPQVGAKTRQRLSPPREGGNR